MLSKTTMYEHFVKWSIYFIGLLVMSLGVVLIIKADLGASPWDVFHIGLYKQLGLTIGTWSIIVGFFILLVSSILTKHLPQMGAFLNMVFVGIFIDMYMMLPFIVVPEGLGGKIAMLIVGLIVNGYGISLYISSRCGAGPRDSLMIALTELTGWKVQYIRSSMEVIVLVVGWFLGGPVFVGTILYSLIIGYIVGFTLPRCQNFSDGLKRKVTSKAQIKLNHNHLSN